MDTTTLEAALTRAQSDFRSARIPVTPEVQETISPAVLIESTPKPLEPLNVSEDSMLTQLTELEKAADRRYATYGDHADGNAGTQAEFDKVRRNERNALASAMKSTVAGTFDAGELRKFDAVTAHLRDRLDLYPNVSGEETQAKDAANRLLEYARRVEISTKDTGDDLTAAERRDIATFLPQITQEVASARLSTLVPRLRGAVQRGERVMMAAYALALPPRLATADGAAGEGELRLLLGRINAAMRPTQPSATMAKATKARNEAAKILSGIEERRQRGKLDPVEQGYVDRYPGSLISVTTGKPVERR